MTIAPVRALVAQLRRDGVIVGIRQGRLVVDAPVGVLTPETKAALRAVKTDLLTILSAEERLLCMSLEEFEQGDLSMEVAVPWLPETTLWFVPTAAHADVLLHEGTPRGRIWTAGELRDLHTSVGLDHDAIERIGSLKAALDCDIVGVLDTGGASDQRPDVVSRERCPACHSRRFWRSVHGVVVCAVCHPPAGPGLVAEWIGEDKAS
jgi:hypothetical protein